MKLFESTPRFSWMTLMLVSTLSIATVALAEDEPADTQPAETQPAETQPQEDEAPASQPKDDDAEAADDEAQDAGPNMRALLDPTHETWSRQAPDVFKVKLTTTKGDVVIQVTREWAPLGADRFYNLVDNGFYDGVKFFRVIEGFMAQFGINGNPKISDVWRDQPIKDDPNTISNARGRITFAMGGPNTRTSQLFISFGDNSFLDNQGFSPFGEVVKGMDVIDKLYAEYGEGAPRGRGPDQGRVQQEGNPYLQADFPKLDSINTARIVE
jgi:cyclophilin family peptidyl-prolyl cis-trans isomerase